jgi:ribosomal protein S18 acetylase RimI-like enzyme
MSDNTLVRVALNSDAATLAVVREAADSQGGSPDPNYFENLVRQNEGLNYVAQSNDSVNGYLVLQRIAHAVVAARNPLQLWQLYVVPAFHGSGVAGQLMNAAFVHARDKGHDVIWLGVSEHNERGIAFYRKQGFKAVGRRLVGLGEHTHQDVVMSRAMGSGHEA